MKTLPFILLALAALSLAGCNGTTVFASAAAAGMWYTRPAKPPPADTASQIPAHENWCYSTMAEPECFPVAQNVEPNRLINVEPQNRHPLTAQQYWEVVYDNR